MIILIHLLEHLGVPSGAAIAIIIAGRKFLKGGLAKMGGRHDRDGGQRRSRDRRSGVGQ
ncbi:MAG TPA: hypothetical protein VMU95_14400 [Trebonia sp.]|nr:hypothetical protein [Trebonia sp.]